MRQPTLKQLRYLCAVADHQHFGQAAAASHVSQSTLSAGILELEETLGVSLVERNNRKVILTPIGDEAVDRARELWSVSKTWFRFVREQESRFMEKCDWALSPRSRLICCRGF